MSPRSSAYVTIRSDRVVGERFPPCRSCAHPSFKAQRLAQHIESHEYFKP